MNWRMSFSFSTRIRNALRPSLAAFDLSVAPSQSDPSRVLQWLPWSLPNELDGQHIGSETATRIAQRLGRTPAQVLLRWGIERDVPVIAKSTHRDRIAENAEIFDFRLSNADMAELDALDRTGGTQRALERKWW
jgi:diketogulonate reductase-like aldo/keto reductase